VGIEHVCDLLRDLEQAMLRVAELEPVEASNQAEGTATEAVAVAVGPANDDRIGQTGVS
jgi:hypothetical protein